MATKVINFRLARDEDAVPLERMINAAFRNDPTPHVFLSADHARIDVTDVDTIAAKIAQTDSAVLLATGEDGALVGHCTVRLLDLGGRAWFGMLAVDVGHQNHGVGGRMLAYAEDYARRRWGCTRMEFDAVCTRVDLIAWYQRRGYLLTGETTPFPYDRHGDWKGVLRDDLHFVILGKNLAEASSTAGGE